MTRTILRLIAALTACLVAIGVLSAFTTEAAHAATGECDTSWTSARDGNFHDPKHWTNGIPSTSKDGCLPDFDAPYVVTSNGPEDSVRNLSNEGAELVFQGSAATNPVPFTITGTFQNDATVVVNPAGAANSRIDGTVVDHGSLMVEYGTLALSSLTVESTGGLTVSANATVTITTLTNLSSGVLSGGTYVLYGSLLVGGASVREIADGASLHLEDGQHVAGSLDLDTSLAIDADSALDVLRMTGANTGAVTNVGVLDLQEGPLTTTSYHQTAGARIELNGTLVAPDGFTADAGSIIDANTAKIDGNVVNHGTLTLVPTNVVTITGSYTSGSDATIDPIVSHSITGQLQIGGTADIAGSLAVDSFDDTQAPTEMPLISAGAIGGGFDTVSAGYAPRDDANSVTLIALARSENDSVGVSYGGWHRIMDGSPQSYSSGTKGDTASVTFDSPSITWNTTVGPDQGRARVTIDGAVVATVDLYNAFPRSVTRTFPLKTGTHQLTITVLGKAGAKSTGTNVAVNGLDAGTTTSLITYDGWTLQDDAPASNGLVDIASTKRAAAASYTFDGNVVDVVAKTGPAEGQIAVSVDGAPATVIDLYSPQSQEQQLEVFNGLALGRHTITVQPLGTKSAASHGKTVALDAFVSIGS